MLFPVSGPHTAPTDYQKRIMLQFSKNQSVDVFLDELRLRAASDPSCDEYQSRDLLALVAKQSAALKGSFRNELVAMSTQYRIAPVWITLFDRYSSEFIDRRPGELALEYK